jgi:hypothetical protein
MVSRKGRPPKWCCQCLRLVRAEREKTAKIVGKRRPHKKTCRLCGQTFASCRTEQQYCSTNCAHLANRRRTVVRCANTQCGKDFEQCAGKSSRRKKFCCMACRRAVHAAMACECQSCGKPFKAKAYQNEWQGKNKYCCRECYLDHRWGSARPAKKASPDAAARACRRSLHTSLRKRCKHYGVPFDPVCTREAVCERDGWVCQQCGVKCHKGRHWFNKTTRKMSKRNAEHDHIVPLSRRDPTKGNTFDNSQCLCRRCNGRKGARGGGQMRLALAEC